MKTIHLSKPLKIKGEDVKDIVLDFDKITGRTMMELESRCRALGDGTPDLTFSMRYQTMMAAKAAGMNYDDLLDLSGKDMTSVFAAVKAFLFQPASEEKPAEAKYQEKEE